MRRGTLIPFPLDNMCVTHKLGTTVITNTTPNHFKILTWGKKEF